MAGVSITFFYKDKRFYFEGWELDRWIDFDINEAIQKGSKKQPCKELVEKIFKKMVKSKFNFRLNVPEDKSRLVDINGLNLEVPWTCQITVLNQVIGTVPIKQLEVTIHRPWSVSKVWDRLAEEVAANIEKIGKAIMDDPAVFGKLLAIIGSEKLAIETLNRIFCRKVKDPGWVGMIGEYVRSKWNDFMKRLKQIWELANKVKDLLAAGAVAAALGAFVELAELALPLLLAIPLLIVLIKFLIDIATESGDDKSKNDMEKLKETVEKHGKELNKDHKDISDEIGRHLFQLGNATVQFLENSDDKVKATWNKIEFPENKGKITFKATFATNEKYEGAHTIEMPDRNATCAAHTNPEFQHVSKVWVRLEANLTLTYEDGEDEDGKKRVLEANQHVEWAGVATHIPSLRRPTQLGFRITDTEPRRVEASFDVSDGSYYEIYISASSSKNQRQLHRSTVAAGADKRVVSEVDLFSQLPEDLLPVDQDNIELDVIAVSTDLAKYKHSAWVKCPSSIPAKRYIQDLKAESADTSVAVSWKETKCGVYRIRMYMSLKENKPLVDKRVTMTDYRNGRRSCLVAMPDNIPQETELYVAVEPIDVPKDLCPVSFVAHWTVFYLPQITILDKDFETCLHLSNNLLTLAVTSQWPVKSTQVVVVEATAANRQTSEIPHDQVKYVPGQDSTSGSLVIQNFVAP